MVNFMKASMGQQAESNPALVTQACSSASKLLEWSAQRLTMEVSEQIEEIYETIDGHSGRLDSLAKDLANTNLNHANALRQIDNLQNQIDSLKNTSSSPSSPSTSSSLSESKSDWFKPGRTHCLLFSGDVDITLNEAKSQVNIQIAHFGFSQPVIKNVNGQGNGRNFTVEFHQSPCSAPAQNGQTLYFQNGEEVAKHVKSAYYYQAPGEEVPRWHQIQFPRGDVEQTLCSYSWNFEKSKARTAREKATRKLLDEVTTSFPNIKDDLTMLKKDGQINLRTYTTIVQLFVAKDGTFDAKLLDDAQLNNLGIDHATFKSLVKNVTGWSG